MEALNLKADSNSENERIDRFLASCQNTLTRSRLESLFAAGKILVNGVPKPKSYKLKPNDSIEIFFEEDKGFTVKPQNITLEIPYEDGHLLVVNKPRGMTVHPSSIDEDGTLANALMYHCGGKLSTIGEAFRPGIIHRIDKHTSGLLVAAKTDAAHAGLSKQAEEHTMLRRYTGVVCGGIPSDEGVIDAPIGRHPVHRTKNSVRDDGRSAVTRYRVLQRLTGFTVAEFELETGRMHQIRVHMAHIGHPLAGDVLYGAKPVKSLGGQCLHAGALGFTYPISGKRLEFFAEPPKVFTDFLTSIQGG